jgi:hypothetical protein
MRRNVYEFDFLWRNGFVSQKNVATSPTGAAGHSTMPFPFISYHITRSLASGRMIAAAARMTDCGPLWQPSCKARP